jgi:THUMP domain-like/RNA cap guanine-N2 methyltransferase
MYPMDEAEDTVTGPGGAWSPLRQARADQGRTGPPPLLSMPGRELLDRLADQDISPDLALALSVSLRAEYPADLVAAALTQQALRVAARAKFSRADRMLFTRAGLEQASSELTGRHAAGRFAAARVVADLCCGIGGNLTALATLTADFGPASEQCGRLVIGVDSDLVSLEFARHNVSVYAPGARVSYVRADVRELPLNGADAVFIDPARRDDQGRLPAGHYEPRLDWCLALAEVVPAVGIKAAPGLRRDLVPPGWETEFVAVGRELKEALLWSPALAGPRSRATVLPSGHTLTSAAPSGQAALAEPGAFLFDPNPAITRAGLVTSLGYQLGAWQIDPMIAFLSSDEPTLTPFARTLRVLHSAPWHEKRFATRLRELGIGSADIRRRGLAGDVRLIHRRLALRGPGAATIVLTRVADRPWGLICVPVSTDDGSA